MTFAGDLFTLGADEKEINAIRLAHQIWVAKRNNAVSKKLTAIARERNQMTLVVSDISKHGVIMVGDSAVTRRRPANPPEVISGAVKVQYASQVNVGIAMWGRADVGGQRLDHWISDFIQNSINPGDSVEAIGNRLASTLNPILQASGKPWKDLVCGFHLGGYNNGVPCLYHVHCGHNTEPAHELRLHKDYPDDQKWSEYFFNYLLQFEFIHLRNGYHPLFGPLFDNMLEYSKSLRAHFNISFPQNSLTSRFEFYKLLVQFVAGVLPVSGLHPGVNQTLSAIAFTPNGLEINEQLSLAPAPGTPDPNLTNEFAKSIRATAVNSTNHDARSFEMDYSARSMPPAAGLNESILGGGRHSVVCAHVRRHLLAVAEAE
ncbi:MAG: hypothetical protein KGJ59_11515 [Bacteroidota bacterium]|nr:hypothetical protein [Bacteroidota bacterium]